MCGIAGIFDHQRPHRWVEQQLSRMIGAIAHRGPDARGMRIDSRIGLAHARLSIIDIASGDQPLCNEDGSVWITFNGEIFNYIELRDDLISRGHTLRTSSDTEVIVHLYEDFGVDCVSRLNGDFAFAVWDSRRGELLLARDRMGVRPLFFTQSSCGLTFASEIKALLTLPGVSAALDPVALDQVFTFWFPLAPRTLFKGVSELPPAHVLVARGGRVDVRRYWSIEYPETHDGRAGQSPIGRKLDEELSELFLDATRIRLRADVPVGAYLSGGLDSSLTAAAVRHLGIGDLKTFSIAFEDPEFDESAFQQNMVTALGTDHSGVLCQADDIAAALPSVVRHAEAPVLRTSPAPMLLLARHVRQQNFKVVLTGEGADEVFGGYDIFKEAKVRRFCASQPQSRLRPQLLRRLYPYLRSLQRQPQHFLEAFFATGDPTDPLYSHIPRFRTTSGAKALFSPSLRSKLAGYDALDDLRQQLPERFGRWHPLAQAQYLETRYLLPSYLLSSQGDRMTMASAVEGRYPFLDHRLVELGAAIPANLKIRGLQEKYILRRSLGPLLPPEIAGRTKQPYRAPESNAFIGSTAPHYVGRHLSHRAIDEGGCFDPAAVTRLVKKVSRNPTLGARDHMAFLGVLTTQIWREEFASSGIGLVQPTGRLGTESEVRTYAAG